MAYLDTFPDGMAGIGAIVPTRGPVARNSGSTTAQDGSEQTFDGAGSVVAFDVELTIKQGRWARDQRGLLLSLGIGGNAMRFTYRDPDIMSPADAGITSLFLPNSSPEIVANVGDQGGVSWSNGQPWSNGFNWQVAYPDAAVAAASTYDSSIVTIADEFWGHGLKRGDAIGFYPNSFGVYWIWRVISPGTYQIWPRLRTALTTAHRARIDQQTLVVRAAGMTAIPPGRNLVSTATHTLSLVELPDPYVRSSFTE